VRHQHHDAALLIDDRPRVRLGAVLIPLRRAAAAAQPESDRCNLRHAADVEDGTEERMVLRQVLRGVLRRRQRLADLLRPHFPGVLAPEVIGPEKAALQQVIAQRLRLRVVEIRGADFRHHDERTLVERRIGEPDHDVLWILRSGEADRRLGQLGEPDRHIDVGARKIDAPPAAVAGAVRAECDAAELPRPVEVFGDRRPHAEPAAPAAAPLRLAGSGDGEKD
jgi:hypothetical protein